MDRSAVDRPDHRVSDGRRSSNIARRALIALWVAFVIVVGCLLAFDRDVFARVISHASGASLVAGAIIYLVLGCLRGFTLIPSTMLVVLGIPFFRPWPLFVLTLAGILVSSASLYRFARALHLQDLVAERHRRTVDRLAAALERYELPVIVGWSFFPLAPTDLICAVCGVLRVSLWKCVLGVAIGEGAICGIYIFAGNAALRYLQVR